MAMTACRSSFFFELTRSSSPWIWALTPLGPSSRMILAIFLAFSWVMPSFSVTQSLYSLPDSWRLGRVQDLQRDTALDQLALEDVEDRLRPAPREFASISMRLAGPGDRGAGPFEVERCEISLAAWLRALSTSCRSTFETMSKLDSAATSARNPHISWARDSGPAGRRRSGRAGQWCHGPAAAVTELSPEPLRISQSAREAGFDFVSGPLSAILIHA